jgi:uncharacterized OB-fold protein
VDALLFETTDKIGDFSSRRSVQVQLNDGVILTNYLKYLSFRDAVEIEWGIRAEDQNRFRPTAAWREHRHFNALIGGRCTRCGTVQFPVARYCVNPECKAKDSQEEHRLADMPAQVVSFTADRLAYSSNPPLLFGMIQFEEGARLMMEFADCHYDDLQVGLPMEMVFRCLQVDKQRNFRNYFWKAKPQPTSRKRG